jgi:predicted CopG family antitoxin
MSSTKTLKMIAISEQNYKRLSQMGHTPESFNDVVTLLLDNINAIHEPKKEMIDS